MTTPPTAGSSVLDGGGSTPVPVVVLISSSGTNLQALIDACQDPAYGVRIAAVGADRGGIRGLDRAREAGIPVFVCRLRDHPDRDAWDAALTAAVVRYGPELVVSAGFLKLVGARFLAHFGGRYVNTHNALLPSFPGIHGPQDALAYGVKVSGATLFVVDEGVDTGAVIAQTAVPVEEEDTVESLTERIKAVEAPQLVQWVGRLARSGFVVENRKVVLL